MTRKQEIIELMTQVIPNLEHCKVLGMEVVDADEGRLILSLPYSQQIIGNIETGVIHGGALTTLLDTACGFAAISALSEAGIAPTLDLRIDYMRPAEPGLMVLGEAETYRVTRNVIFARGLAYHEGKKDDPIAHCTATFMRLDAKSAVEKLTKIGAGETS